VVRACSPFEPSDSSFRRVSASRGREGVFLDLNKQGFDLRQMSIKAGGLGALEVGEEMFGPWREMAVEKRFCMAMVAEKWQRDPPSPSRWARRARGDRRAIARADAR
jgi:hypothetical protein